MNVFKRYQKNLVYLFIFLLPFVLFFFQPKVFTSLKDLIVSASSLPIRIISFPINEAKKILYYHRTFEEYKRLQKEVETLRHRILGQEELIKENTRLEKLLDFKRRLIYQSVPANVIGRDPSFWNSSIIIDRGHNDGIKQDQPVVNAFGVVGKIAEVSETTSKVILLTDPQFSVAALIQRPREVGLVSGTLSGMCRMKFINPDANIKIGDRVITSKLSSSFPELLAVGEIVEIIENKQNLNREYIIRPAVKFSQLEEVLVIVK